MVRELMNRHQRTDKGLGGPAAGPDAALRAEQCFAGVGYRVRREPSDWTLGPTEHDMQRLLIDGWAHAATDLQSARRSSNAGTPVALRTWMRAVRISLSDMTTSRHGRPARTHRSDMPAFETADIRRYYDRPRSFVRFGQGGRDGAIHRASGGPASPLGQRRFTTSTTALRSLTLSLPGRRGMSCLVDLGCGIGASLCYLAERLPVRATGITLSPV